MDIKKSLLTSLKLIAFYICISVFMCVALAAIYMIYTLCINMVAGQQLKFDIKLFLDGVLLFLPLVLVLQAMFMTLWMIRHPESTIMPIAFYALIYVASWVFVLPATVKEAQLEDSRYAGQNVSDKPSPGYFRSSSDKIFYYSSVSEDSSLANGLCIATDKSSDNVFTFSNVRLSQKRTTFTDSLIQNTIEMPASLSIIVRYVQDFFAILSKCSKGGLGYWLCFSTMALPLLAVVALRRFSPWRMVSVISIIFVTFGMMAFNIAGYANSGLVAVENSINEVLTKIPPLRTLARISNPCVMLTNIVVFIILTAAFFAFEFKNRKYTEGSGGSYDNDTVY